MRGMKRQGRQWPRATGPVGRRGARGARKYRLQDLVELIPKGYRPREVRWGRQVGKEAW